MVQWGLNGVELAPAAAAVAAPACRLPQRQCLPQRTCIMHHACEYTSGAASTSGAVGS